MKFNTVKIYFHITFSLMLLLLVGCGETNYIFNNHSSPIREGFLGFRWTTPMSIVETEFQKQPGVKAISKLNKYNTSCFSGVNFLGYSTSLCQFTFNRYGLSSVKLLIQSSDAWIKEDFFSLKDKLAEIYGTPLEAMNKNRNLDLIKIFSWEFQKLQLILTPDNKIEIYAYRENLPLKPINNIIR